MHSRPFSHLRFAALLVAVSLAAAGAPAQVRFSEVTESAGIHWTHQNGATPEKYLIETMGGGGAFFDFDNDGWMDLFLVDSGSHLRSGKETPSRHVLYRNNRDGTFTDVTARAGVGIPTYGMGAAVGDFDNDGWKDLYITNYGSNRLLRNRGDGSFQDVTSKAGLINDGWSTSAAFFDLENDGDLDLFVCRYVEWDYDTEVYCGQPQEGYRSYCHPRRYSPTTSLLYLNQGDGTFSDISRQSGIQLPGKALGVVTGDVNRDGLADLYVANDTMANFLFINNGDGTFKETGMISNVALGFYGQAESGMGTDFGDYDNDGKIDLIVTNLDNEMNNLYANQGENWFLDMTLAAGLGRVAIPYSGFGVRFLDYDNDSDLDLVVLNGHVQDNIALYRSGVKFAEPPLLLENTGEGKFSERSAEAGEIWERPLIGRALAAADYDNDGDPDLLFVNNSQPPVLLRNEGGNRNRWVGIYLKGTRSNRDGVGAQLTATSGSRQLFRELHGGSSYQAAQDPRILFGLGEGEAPISLEIRWPSGRLQKIDSLAPGRYHTIQEPPASED